MCYVVRKAAIFNLGREGGSVQRSNASLIVVSAFVINYCRALGKIELCPSAISLVGQEALTLLTWILIYELQEGGGHSCHSMLF